MRFKVSSSSAASFNRVIADVATRQWCFVVIGMRLLYLHRDRAAMVNDDEADKNVQFEGVKTTLVGTISGK